MLVVHISVGSVLYWFLIDFYGFCVLKSNIFADFSTVDLPLIFQENYEKQLYIRGGRRVTNISLESLNSANLAISFYEAPTSVDLLYFNFLIGNKPVNICVQ